jgi:hypothetical protein
MQFLAISIMVGAISIMMEIISGMLIAVFYRLAILSSMVLVAVVMVVVFLPLLFRLKTVMFEFARMCLSHPLWSSFYQSCF